MSYRRTRRRLGLYRRRPRLYRRPYFRERVVVLQEEEPAEMALWLGVGALVVAAFGLGYLLSKT